MRHPNVANVRELGRPRGGGLFLLMDRFESSLADRLRDGIGEADAVR